MLTIELFRNYLDYVEDSITDWLKEEEAKYQAYVLSKELEKMRQDEETASRLAERAAKKGSKRSTSMPLLVSVEVLIVLTHTAKMSYILKVCFVQRKY